MDKKKEKENALQQQEINAMEIEDDQIPQNENDVGNVQQNEQNSNSLLNSSSHQADPSLMNIVDGINAVPEEPAQDHKAKKKDKEEDKEEGRVAPDYVLVNQENERFKRQFKMSMIVANYLK